VNLADAYISPSNDLYLVTELCSSDLHTVITTQPLELSHIRYFVYQMLRALKVLPDLTSAFFSFFSFFSFCGHQLISSFWSFQVRSLSRSASQGPEAQQHSGE